MADEQPTKTRRRVKNPETFRERALKAGEAATRTKTDGPVKRGLAAIFRPAGRFLKTIFASPPFRFLGKILRPLGKVLFIRQLRDSWAELRQVTWPNWSQSYQLTFAVLIFAVMFGAAIAGVDYVLDKAFRHILLK
jgi:preprotein translocase SecE subunit